jgi:hypothetical protein
MKVIERTDKKIEKKKMPIFLFDEKCKIYSDHFVKLIKKGSSLVDLDI